MPSQIMILAVSEQPSQHNKNDPDIHRFILCHNYTHQRNNKSSENGYGKPGHERGVKSYIMIF